MPGALFDRYNLFLFGISERSFRVILLSLALVWAVGLYEERKGSVREAVSSFALPLRWLCYYAFIVVIVVFGYYGPGFNAAAFQYLQF